MADPSAQVATPLLGHLHAVSRIQYAPFQTVTVEMVGELLLKAPQVAQQYPFTWTMLDTPQEASLFLVWVPPTLNGGCASDGYVWVDPDQGYSMPWKGYVGNPHLILPVPNEARMLALDATVEMIQTKSGFIPGTEKHALHTRRRYRLVSGPNTHPTAPAPDPNLWLYHYIRADRQNQLPVAGLQLGQHVSQTQATRRYIANIQQQGLISKEFFLHDRSSWPVISFGSQQLIQTPAGKVPGAAGAPHTPQGARHISPMSGRGPVGTPAQAYYGGNVGVQASPAANLPVAKRLKPTPPAAALPQAGQQAGSSSGVPPGGVAAMHDPPITIDEEEDTSRGDMLDHLTPREISTARYTQHHEWMEEVLGSVYSISKIKPTDLGLGLRGELEELTKGLVEPPMFPPVRKNPTAPAKEDDDSPGLTGVIDEFRNRANAKISAIEEEMEKMKATHQKRLEKIKKSQAIRDGERKLRAQLNFDIFGTDGAGNGEESATEGGEPDPTSPSPKTANSEEEIIRTVEEALNKKVAQRDMVVRWEVEGGRQKGNEKDEVKDEIMGNTADAAIKQQQQQEQSIIPSDTQPTSTASSTTNNDIPEIEDVVMGQDDTMMDEPTLFDEAFAETAGGMSGDDDIDVEDPLSSLGNGSAFHSSTGGKTLPAAPTAAAVAVADNQPTPPPISDVNPETTASPGDQAVPSPNATTNDASNASQPSPPAQNPSPTNTDTKPISPTTTTVPTVSPVVTQAGDVSWVGIPGLGTLPPPHHSLPPRPPGPPAA